MVLGSSGGPKIITSIIQVILNHAILGIPLYEAVTHPRVHDQLLYHMAAGTGYDLSKLKLQPGKPTIEVRKSTLDALTKRGHNMFSLDYLGTTQAVGVDLETDKLTAVSDVRKNGQSSGY
jgi:gamma-glutamyltranspeptidase